MMQTSDSSIEFPFPLSSPASIQSENMIKVRGTWDDQPTSWISSDVPTPSRNAHESNVGQSFGLTRFIPMQSSDVRRGTDQRIANNGNRTDFQSSAFIDVYVSDVETSAVNISAPMRVRRYTVICYCSVHD